MKLSTKCSIAMHCLIFIAEYEEKIKVTSELLAKSTGCNAAAIRSILNALQKADIISVVRGVGGAYLKRKPEELNMWEIYRALEPEGLEHFIGVHSNPSSKCPIGQQIREVLKEPYDEIGEAVKQAMEKITLQDVLERYHEHPYDSACKNNSPDT